MHHKTRANLLAQWVCDLDVGVEGPNIGYIRNKRRGSGVLAYDYTRGNVRVKIKSSRMHFDKHHQRWIFFFQHIELSAFDELRLIFYAPSGLYVYIHDGVYWGLQEKQLYPEMLQSGDALWIIF